MVHYVILSRRGVLMHIEKISLNEDRPEVNLVTYIQNHSKEVGKKPAVIVLAGGSFMYKSERESEPIALKFASMGYQAFVLNYTTYTEKNKRPDYSKPFETKEYTQFPMQLKEIAEAFHVIHENAEEWQIDTDEIGLAGFSAGGFHSAMYGTNWHRPLVTDLVDHPVEELKPAFMILSYALTDILFGRDYEEVKKFLPILDDETSKYFKAIMIANFGGTDVSKETVEIYSPIKHINENTPPAFIWSTFEDKTVPVQESIAFAKAMVDKQVPCELHIFEKGGHGLATAQNATARSENEANIAAGEWFNLAEKWLNIHAPVKPFNIN